MRDVRRLLSTVALDGSSRFLKEAAYPVRRFLQQSKTSWLLVREPAEKLIRRLSHRDSEQEAERVRVVLDGPAGSGKSLALLHVAQWASDHSYIVISIPCAYSFANHGAFLAPMADPSGTGPDVVYGQTDFAMSLVRRVKEQYGDSIHRFILSRPYTVTRKRAGEDVESVVKTVGDVLDYGLSQRDSLVSVVAWDILVRELASQTKHKVMFTIDGVDSLYDRTKHRAPTHEHLHASQLALTRSLLAAIAAGHGADAVAATSRSRSHTEDVSGRLYRLGSPDRSLSVEWAKLHIPNFSVAEAGAFARLLKEAGHGDPAISVARMHFLSSGNPRQLFRMFGGDVFYTNEGK